MATQTPNDLPEENLPIVSARGKRLRPVTPRELLRIRQAELDFRFVREIEYLEREGRVSNRRALEEAVGLTRSDTLAIRAGKRGVSLLNVVLLHEKYRGDRDFIMYGVRNKELAAPYISGIGRIDRYDSYIFEYQAPARWLIGPRPETDPAYCPSDPKNELWQAPTRASKPPEKE